MPIRLLIALLAILLPLDPAGADITARYRTLSGDALMVQVNARGDSRISRGSSSVLTLGGISYVVVAHRRGDFAVRQDAMMAELERRERAQFPGPRSPLLLRTDGYRPVASGTETVGGRTGTRWVLRDRDEEHPEDWVFVITSDPDLAPLGRALARQFSIGEYRMFMSNAPESGLGGVPASLHRLIAEGTVIRMHDYLALERVERGPVPNSAFALPRRLLPPRRFLARAPWISRPILP